MSDKDVEIEVLEPMQRVFQPPWKMGDEEQRNSLREYVSALRSFDTTDLNAAWCTVRDTHTTRGWPVPAAFVMAARQSRKYRIDVERAAPSAAKAGADNGNWDKWKAASRTPKAKEAAKMGVAWAFKCAVLNDGKDPSIVDLRELRQAKNSAERTAELIRDGGVKFSADNAALAMRMWRTLLVNEETARQEIQHVAA